MFAMADAENTTTNESLLLPVDRAEKVTWRDLRDGSFTYELKRLICFAAPMAAVVIAQSMWQIISMVMVGHLGKLSLAGASLASSFCNVTGFSAVLQTLLLGIVTACTNWENQKCLGRKMMQKEPCVFTTTKSNDQIQRSASFDQDAVLME
ncbi:unnamed protein product [Arabis nemorensis]|uniref:Protein DETOXIFICATION n=1 Tax=Arabis nemorensis TaxID=586526 RepID=A0A565ARZ1_9BRAS|nr:unnamed protein product [Arabis nemorensis]